MFITIGSIATHMSEMAGQTMLALPQARVATAVEAAQCINRMVLNGMDVDEANENFKRIYTKPLSASESYKPLPNECMTGFSASGSVRECEGWGEQFKHLFNPDGEVL